MKEPTLIKEGKLSDGRNMIGIDLAIDGFGQRYSSQVRNKILRYLYAEICHHLGREKNLIELFETNSVELGMRLTIGDKYEKSN